MKETKEAFFGLLFVGLCLLNPLFAASQAQANDARYTLTEYTMNGCPACEAALKDVAELIDAGLDVRCVNTSTDRQAAYDARRYKLYLRPAWRLAKADGSEIARWYGAGRADVIAATIRAKFPTIESIEETVETPTVDDAPKPSLVDLDETPTNDDEKQSCNDDFCLVYPLPGLERFPDVDFRDRAPVLEPFQDVDFLDKSQRLWDEREKDLDGEEPEAEEERDDEEENRLRLFGDRNKENDESDELKQTRLGDRIADRASANILKGLDPYLAKFEKNALDELGKIGGDATKAVEILIEKKFADVQRTLEGRFDGAVDDIKGAILKQVHKEIHDALKKIGAFLVKAVILLVVAFGVWKYYKSRKIGA